MRGQHGRLCHRDAFEANPAPRWQRSTKILRLCTKILLIRDRGKGMGILVIGFRFHPAVLNDVLYFVLVSPPLGGFGEGFFPKQLNSLGFLPDTISDPAGGMQVVPGHF